MRKPTDPKLREEATSEGGFLTSEQVAENRSWFEKWDAYVKACQEYDEAAQRALRPGYSGPAPVAPRSFWGRGRPHPPHMPPLKKAKEMCVYVTIALPLSIAAVVEARKGTLTASKFCTNIVTSILSNS